LSNSNLENCSGNVTTFKVGYLVVHSTLKIVKVSDLIYKENYIIDNNGAQKLVNV
jgi:hypothetical protein